MTGKERAAFRAQANHLEPLFQVGKGGMSEALIKQTDDALRARELIKVKVLLESSPITPRETADELASATGASSTPFLKRSNTPRGSSGVCFKASNMRSRISMAAWKAASSLPY